MIIAILTCHNRKSETVTCITSLIENNTNIEFKFVVVDDNSTDGTREALLSMSCDITIIEGDGQLFWNGGMHRSLSTKHWKIFHTFDSLV